MEAPKPSGTNYIDVKQVTKEWIDICKNRISGSRLPALIGLYGKKKFESIGMLLGMEL